MQKIILVALALFSFVSLQAQDKKIATEVQNLRDENQLLKKGLLDLQTQIEQARQDASKQTGAKNIAK